MKINYFKSGGVAYMLLGIMHLLAHLSGGGKVDPQLANTFAIMENSIIYLMGKHTLLQFYNGFSLTMGFLLFSLGLQVFMIDKPRQRIILVNILISVVTLILTIIYFHYLATGFILLAMICFIIHLFKSRKTTLNA